MVDPIEAACAKGAATTRFALRAVVALLLPACAWLVCACGGSTPTTQPKQAETLSQSWALLSQRGLSQERSGIGRWPFASIHVVAGGMPRRLRKEALKVVGGPMALPLHLRFDRARHVTTASPGGLWFVPGRGVACLFRAAGMASSCDTLADAYRHGMLLEVYKLDKPRGRPTAFTAVGIVPNGVSRLSAKIGQRKTSIPVRGNAFTAHARTAIDVRAPTR